MNFVKKHIHAIIGVIIYMIIVILILILLGFTTPLPLPEEEGILIDFGGSGAREVSSPAPASRTEVTPSSQTTGVITQDYEETASMPSSSVPSEAEIIEDPVETAAQTAERLNERLGGVFGSGTSGTQTGSGTGHPGMGDRTHGGTGGGPSGVGGSLEGRRLLKIVDPEGKDNMTGTVVLRITVDENGNVSNIRMVRTTCSECVELARKAVSQWKYASSPGTGYQTGEVIINFEQKQ